MGVPLRLSTINNNKGETVIKRNYNGIWTDSEKDRVRYPINQYRIKTDWATLEPTRGTFNFNAIKTYMAAHPTVNVRLHVSGGGSSPAWLKKLVGTVDVRNPGANETQACPKYWVQAHKDRWAALCKAVGAAFDTNPHFAGMNMAGCSLVSDESWIMGNDAPSLARLFDAGLNKATCYSAPLSGMTALTKALPTTICEFAAHGSWTYPIAGGKLARDWPGGRSMLNNWHDLYGDHLVVTDYGLGPTDYHAAQPRTTTLELYSWMHQRADEGYPVAWQLGISGGVQNPNPSGDDKYNAASNAVKMGGRWVEHANWGLCTTTQVKDLNSRLLAAGA